MIDLSNILIWVKVHWKNVFYFFGSCAGFYSLYKTRPRLKIKIESQEFTINPMGDGDYKGDYAWIHFDGHVRNEGSQPTSIINAIIESDNEQINGKRIDDIDLFHDIIESSRPFRLTFTFDEPPKKRKIKGKIKFNIAKKLFPKTVKFELEAKDRD